MTTEIIIGNSPFKNDRLQTCAAFKTMLREPIDRALERDPFKAGTSMEQILRCDNVRAAGGNDYLLERRAVSERTETDSCNAFRDFNLNEIDAAFESGLAYLRHTLRDSELRQFGIPFELFINDFTSVGGSSSRNCIPHGLCQGIASRECVVCNLRTCRDVDICKRLAIIESLRADLLET